MARTFDYVIVTNTNIDTVMTTVEGYLGDGWALVGGCSIAYNGTNIVYAQAVCKRLT